MFLSDPDLCRRVRVITLRDEALKLVEFLRRECALHVVQTRLAGEKEEKLIQEMLGILSRAQKVYSEFIKRLEGEKVVKLEYVPPAEELPKVLRETVEQLEKELNDIVVLEKRLNEIEQRLVYLRKVKTYLLTVHSQLGNVSISDLDFEGEAVEVKTIEGTTAAARRFLDELGSIIHVLASAELEDRIAMTVAYSALDKELVRSKIREYGLVVMEFPYRGSIDEVLRFIDEENSKLLQELGLRAKVGEIISRNLDRLALLKLVLENEYEKYRALQLAIATKHAFVVEGWVPESIYNKFCDYLENQLKIAIVESVETDEEPPVEFKNLKIFKPFELITKLYGYPSPREWDPTPLLAYSFIVFYGIMLGDCGYGIAQILAARYILPKFVEDPESEGFRNLQKILYITGIASAIVGLITGSVFGFYPVTKWTSWLRGIVLLPNEPVSMMSTLMELSLIIGFVHVMLAHLIAGAKNWKLKERWAALNEFAIVMAMVFGGPYALHVIGQIRLPATLANYVFKPLAFASLGLIILSKIKTMGGVGLMLWLFDLTGALGDVLSYLRLAGLAIATVILARVFDSIFNGIITGLPAMIGQPIGLVIGIAVGIVFFMIAHAFNIAISVLGAFVHSLRLCILEFSSKFYEGSGKPFTPLRIALHRYVPLRR